MLATIIICAIVFIALTASIIFFPSIKIKNLQIGSYWLIALVGAVLLISFGAAPLDVVFDALTANSAINPLKILALFFSMTFLSVYLDEVGLFRFLAKKAVAKVGSKQISLFLVLYALTAVLTVFTSNDIVILTLTPFICFFCKNARINPLPYLVGEFAAANTWSMMLVIGNPTNIYLATSAGIGFLDYFKVMALPTLLSGIAELLLIVLLFFRHLKAPLSPQEDDFAVKNKVGLTVGVFHLFVCLVFLAISGYLGIEMWLASVVCALSLLVFAIVFGVFDRGVRRDAVNCFSRLPYQLIPFVLSMFVVVVALNEQGITQKIAALLGEQNSVLTYGVSSYLVANVINNIPMSMLYCSITSSLSGAEFLRAIYASVIGSNVGAFVTPIGALAGIMFTKLTKEHQVDYSFKRFIGYGAAISLPTLAVALLVLSVLI